MNWRTLSLAVAALLAVSALGVAAQEPGSGTEPSPSPTPPPPGEPPSPSNGSAPPPCPHEGQSCSPSNPPQGPPGSGGPSSDPATQECFRNSTTNDQRRACVQSYCDTHQDQFCAKWCQEHPEGANCANQPPIQPQTAADPTPPTEQARPRDCEGEQASPDGACPPKAEPGHDGALEYIAFTRMPGERGLHNYTVSGTLLLVRLEWVTDGDIQTARHGNLLEARVGDERLMLHDEPGGLLAFKGRNSTVVLEFPADAKIERDQARHEARITLGDGSVALLRYDDGVWASDHIARLNGFVGLHLPPAYGRDDLDRRGPEKQADRDEVEKAIEDRRLGAQVAIGDDSVPNGVEVLSYDDVQVNVSKPDGKATVDDPLTIRVEADLSEGRTVSVDIAKKLLPASTEGQMVLRYFDVNDDGSQTEVLLAKATDINDVLNPTDDDGQPEYWVVFDAQGAHVLVSVPHWSIHVFTVAAVPLPNVTVGIIAGAGLSVVAGVALFLRRRD